MTETRRYGIDRSITDRGEAETACAAVFDVLGSAVVAAHVDVFSDYAAAMTEPVRGAELWLQGRAGRRRKRLGDPAMDVVVRAEEPEWAAVRVYAPWSINTDLEGADGQVLATFHDCGYSTVAVLDDQQVDHLRELLAHLAPVVLLSEIHERRRLEKAERKRTRLRRILSRMSH